MGKLSKAIVLIAIVAAVSACHAGAGIGSNDTQPHTTYLASNSMDSAEAQASIGTVAAVRN